MFEGGGDESKELDQTLKVMVKKGVFTKPEAHGIENAWHNYDDDGNGVMDSDEMKTMILREGWLNG